jgi:hypothetical protein
MARIDPTWEDVEKYEVHMATCAIEVGGNKTDLF